MKVGLVLEGGALRTIFSTGVCDALLERGLMADYIVGVSAGIAYGVSYASRQPRRNLKILTTYAGDRRYMGLRNLARRGNNRCYFGLEFMYKTIPEGLVPFDYEAFAAFPGEVEAAVTNLETGRAEYLPVPRGRGDTDLLLATCALPLMFPVVWLDSTPYMDGGAADSIPWRRALETGCDRLVVVLTRPRDYRKTKEGLLPLIRRKYRDYPNFVAALERRAQAYNDSRDALFALEREGKALVLAPETTLGVSRLERDKAKLQLLWGAGYQQAAARMEELEAWFGR